MMMTMCRKQKDEGFSILRAWYNMKPSFEYRKREGRSGVLLGRCFNLRRRQKLERAKATKSDQVLGDG